ncbi:MAG: D-alanyl-D-alanine carboxypeptidase [Oscillospiraceae bacterium]|nr:D-alanyl-D-alanine carboxypeptidase [Oscillospiraceae bacterium]
MSIILLVAIIFQFSAAPVYASAPGVEAKAYILVDADSGEILYEVNSTQVLVPASMTKLMTLYLVLERIAENRLSWTDQVTISEFSNLISRQPSLSSFLLPAGANYTVEELFYAAALNSSNAGAIALAEHIGGGSEGAFVRMMNEKARSFGLADTVFVNSSGLNNADLFGRHPEGTGAREDTRLSARSMATIAFRLINDYPVYLEFSSMQRTTIKEGTPDQVVINSTNRMLAGSVYAVEGVKGLKTGYTFNAGYCFASYAERRSGRFITIVMGATTTEERFRGSGRLLDFGFAIAEGRESRLIEQVHAYLYPDGLNYYDRAKNGSKSLLTLGDTGFGMMDNGKSDVLIYNGNLYCISKRGHVSRLDDPSGVGSAALTFFSRDGEIKLTGERGLYELENALLLAVDDTVGSSYCFKIEGDVRPRSVTTVSNAGMEYASGGGSGSGAVVGFWNHASENDILRHGFTFYYLDADRRGGGVLAEADFGDLSVRIDRIEPMDMVFGRGEDIPILVR